jgi:hypothetical protein
MRLARTLRVGGSCHRMPSCNHFSTSTHLAVPYGGQQDARLETKYKQASINPKYWAGPVVTRYD